MHIYNEYNWYFNPWDCCIFVRRPVVEIKKSFGNRICFRHQVRGWEIPILLGLLERDNLSRSIGPNRVVASHASHENGNKSRFRNAVFFSVLQNTG
jgi:hypothetical protein